MDTTEVTLKPGDRVKRKSGAAFSNGEFICTVISTDSDRVWLKETRTWATRFTLELAEKAPASSLDVQIGGGHYKDMVIQPIEYNIKNNIPFAEGNVIKYVSRWRNKNGVEDLKKARHILDILIETEEKSNV